MNKGEDAVFLGEARNIGHEYRKQANADDNPRIQDGQAVISNRFDADQAETLWRAGNRDQGKFERRVAAYESREVHQKNRQ